jgi:phosphate transport system permease protein
VAVIGVPGDARPNAASDEDTPLRVVVSRSASDRAYRGVAYGAGLTTLGLMTVIGVFLVKAAIPAFQAVGFKFFTETRWLPTPAGAGAHFGVASVLLGTAIIAVIALVLAVPIAIGTALFITEYAPTRVRRFLTSVIDLLAAVPSLIYGIWGAAVLQGKVVHLSKFLADHLGWFPGFHTTSISGTGRTTLSDFSASGFLAGIVVALMILPICTAVMREVFSQAPPGEKEGALALGGTRWGVIRDVVLPFGRGGIIGGSMLGLGRALGETIAVALIVSRTTRVHDLLQVLKTGGNSIAALIARTWAEASGVQTAALMAAGLVLFVVTLLVNAAASYIVDRSRSGAATEI